MDWEPKVRHPLDTGPCWVDEDGLPAQVVICPDCGQMEFWTEWECNHHGKCRGNPDPCWCKVEKQESKGG